MKKLFKIPTLLFALMLIVSSCEKDIEGCTDTLAVNFNSDATLSEMLDLMPKL